MGVFDGSVNRVILSGHASNISGSNTVTTFDFLNVSKEREYESSARVKVVAFGELAPLCANIQDGARLYIEGSLSNKSKETPSGKKRYYTEVIASKVEKL